MYFVRLSLSLSISTLPSTIPNVVCELTCSVGLQTIPKGGASGKSGWKGGGEWRERIYLNYLILSPYLPELLLPGTLPHHEGVGELEHIEHKLLQLDTVIASRGHRLTRLVVEVGNLLLCNVIRQ